MIITRATCMLLFVAASCDQQAATTPTKTPPAKLQKASEQALLDVILTQKAHDRLGIHTEAARLERIVLTRTMGGEVTLPPDATIPVAAPFAGTITVKETLPMPGDQLATEQVIMWLTPLPDPVIAMNMSRGLVEAKGATSTAETRQQAAQIAHARAVALLRDGAGSQLEVDTTKAELDAAETAHRVARQTVQAIEATMGDIEAGTRKPIAIKTPHSGLLASLQATDGQPVAAGAPLFTVTTTKDIWIRVPIYVGTLPDIDSSGPAEIAGLAARPGQPSKAATPIHAPPSANAIAGTVDLYYSLRNEQQSLRPGQRVNATLPTISAAESLTVPWPAVIHDIYGGTWVYTEVSPLTFRRQRVAIERVHDNKAVLRRGPAVGTAVVTDGAAELFGTEFGNGK